MTRELLILRHGKSDWRQDVSDFDRPLKNRGVRGAQKMGAWISRHQLLPDVLYSSPAVRAKETAYLCCESMGLPIAHVILEQSLYLADDDQLLTLLGNVDNALSRIMIVGHNPGLEDLVIYLLGDCTPGQKDGKLLPTATLVHIAIPDGWTISHRGQGELLNLVRARELP